MSFSIKMELLPRIMIKIIAMIKSRYPLIQTSYPTWSTFIRRTDIFFVQETRKKFQFPILYTYNLHTYLFKFLSVCVHFSISDGLKLKLPVYEFPAL